jgi:hypothetical protein
MAMPVLVLIGCVEPQVAYESSRPSADVIELRMGYPEAFDAVVRALEREGYTIDVADQRTGLIRTEPKAGKGTGEVSYKTVVVVRMGGTDRDSWLAADVVAMPTFPAQERAIRDRLKGLAP